MKLQTSNEMKLDNLDDKSMVNDVSKSVIKSILRNIHWKVQSAFSEIHAVGARLLAKCIEGAIIQVLKLFGKQ